MIVTIKHLNAVLELENAQEVMMYEKYIDIKNKARRTAADTDYAVRILNDLVRVCKIN